MRDHLLTGRKGEEAAAAFLTSKGFEILGRNVRTVGGEIDLIARDADTVVFVEVKAREHADGIAPSVRVDHAKIGRLEGAALAWMEGQFARGAKEFPARLDVVGVCEERVVEHYEDVTT